MSRPGKLKLSIEIRTQLSSEKTHSVQTYKAGIIILRMKTSTSSILQAVPITDYKALPF